MAQTKGKSPRAFLSDVRHELLDQESEIDMAAETLNRLLAHIKRRNRTALRCIRDAQDEEDRRAGLPMRRAAA